MNLNTYKIETFIEKMKTMTVPEMAEEKETNVNSFWSYISKYKVYEHPLFLEYFKEKGVDRGTKHRAYLRIIRHIEAKPKKFRHVTFKGILPGKTSEAKGNIAVKNNNIQIVFTCNYCGTEKIKHCVSDVLRATGEKKCTGCAELLANKGERYCSGCNETHPLDAFNEGTWACRASVAKKREEAPEEYNIYRKYQAVKLRAKKQNIPCNFTLEGLGITVTQEKRRNGSPRYKASGYPKVCPVLNKVSLEYW